MPKNRAWLTPRARWGGSLLALALILSGLSGSVTPSAAAPPAPGKDPPVVIELPPEAFEINADSIPLSSHRTGTKIESSFQEQIIALQTSRSSLQDVRPQSWLNVRESRVHAQIALDAGALKTISEYILQAGGEVTGTSKDGTLIQCWLPLDAISQIADLSGVYMIRRPDEAILLEQTLGTGSTTEALEAMNALAWHAAGQIGAGVRVGVIDTGFEGYGALIGTDLPAPIDVRNFVDGENPIDVNGTTDHGTSCAEIVYDVAPGVRLYLAKVSTNIDLQEAVEWLKSKNVDVISTSLTWYNVTPGDGTGEFADLVTSARNDGIFWVTAAGNDRENHWGGPFTDSNSDGIHEFAGNWVNCFGPETGGCYAIQADEPLRVFLRWDDWTTVTQDFDLYLVRWNGTEFDLRNPIASSANPQEGRPGQRPTEYAAALTSGAATAYGFVIRRFDSTRSVNLEVFTPKSRGLTVRLPARSLGNLADAPDAMTVAALDVNDPFPHEDYSSEGPTNGIGGIAEGGLIKPDLAAYANVSTQGYGVRGFDGTSAATPHVAGAAALVLGLHPDYTPDDIEAFLQAQAVDMGALGQDTVYGYGRLYLGEHSPAPVVTGITPSAGVYTGSIRITNLAGEFFKPGATVRLSKSNHDPIIGTNVTWVNENTLTLNLNLAGAANGSWDVVVTNPDGKSGRLDNGFTVASTATAPRVLGITPSRVTVPRIVSATVIGQGFAVSGAKPTVKLTQAGQKEIVATQVSVVDSATLTCQFSLDKTHGGVWNVKVINPNGEYWVLSEAFSTLHQTYLPAIFKDYPPPPPLPETLYAVEDTMVVQDQPTVNYDTSTDMWVGYDRDECHKDDYPDTPLPPGIGDQIGRSLIQFDTSAMQPGAYIPQAKLYMFLAYACDVPDRSRTVTLHRVTSLWSSKTVVWTTRPAFGEQVSSQTIPPRDEAAGKWYTFDVTELVRGWVNGDYINMGIGIKGPESSVDGARFGFITDDYLGGAYAPRIIFSNEAQAGAALTADTLPTIDQHCLPEPLSSFAAQGGSSQLIGAPLCPAD